MIATALGLFRMFETRFWPTAFRASAARATRLRSSCLTVSCPQQWLFRLARILGEASYHDFGTVYNPESALVVKLPRMVARTTFLKDSREAAFIGDVSPRYWCVTILWHGGV